MEYDYLMGYFVVNEIIQKKKVEFKNVLYLSEEYKYKIREWRNQDFVRNNMINRNIISLDEHVKFLQNLELNSFKEMYLAFYDNVPFAILQLDFSEDNQIMELGYYLIDSENLGCGLGVILNYASLKYAFERRNVKKIVGRVLSFNRSALRLNTKMGFITENIFKEHIKNDDNYIEVYIQCIYYKNWVENKKNIARLLYAFISSMDIVEIGNY